MILQTQRTSISKVCHGQKISTGFRGAGFDTPFILSSENILQFIESHLSFSGKFVFNLDSRELVLGSRKKPHEDLASAIGSNRKIGAYIEFGKEDNNIYIILRGSSQRFGKPEAKDMKIVASFIKNLLEDIGIKALERELEDEGILIQASLDSTIPIKDEYPPNFILIAQPECSS
jgi:hypothetical protein